MLIRTPDWQSYMAMINKKRKNKLLLDKGSLFGRQKSFLKMWGTWYRRREIM
jgi:hypothetical protein